MAPQTQKNTMQNNDNSSLGFDQEIRLPEISDVPPAIEGSGGDEHTNKVAILIAQLTLDFDQAWGWMKAWNKICRPEWQEYRLKQKTESAWNYVHPDELVVIPVEERPRARARKVSFKRLNAMAFTAKGKYDELLEGVSGREIPSAEAVIDDLYPGNPWICRAAGSPNGYTDRRESFRGVEKEFEWIVPSPMSAQTGYARSTGNPRSYRCLENAGPLRYMVIEFDFTSSFQAHIDAWAKEGISPRDVQARLIEWLGLEEEIRQWPFMIVDSGKKSLHSWYAIHEGFPLEDALELLTRALPYGADKHGESPCWLFRFPGGTRKSDKGQPQPIIFYDKTKLV